MSILTIVGSAIAGAVVFGFILRNNPKLAKKLGIIADKIVDQIDDITEDKKSDPGVSIKPQEEKKTKK